MKTVKEHCLYLGWSVAELSRQADINYRTAAKAYHGISLEPRSQQKIAAAFSKVYGQRLNVGDIAWPP